MPNTATVPVRIVPMPDLVAPVLPPRLVPEAVPVGQSFLSLDTLEEGTFLDRAESAWRHLLQEVVRRNAKGSVTLKVTLEPSREEGHEGHFDAKTSIKIGLPEVKDVRVYAPSPALGAIVTDLRVVRKVLRPLGAGRFTDDQGRTCDVDGQIAR